MSENEGWKVVGRHDKHTSRRQRPHLRPAQDASSYNHLKTKNLQRDLQADDRRDALPAETVYSQLATCVQHLRKSQFFANLKQALANPSPEENNNNNNNNNNKIGTIQEIVCYGIGNFAHGGRFSGPLWQLACVNALRDELKAIKRHANKGTNKFIDDDPPRIYFFDPLTTDLERDILQHYNICVLERNERGKRVVLSNEVSEKDTRTATNLNDKEPSSHPSATLFFMPHCPKGLYENVLWANWKQLQGSVASSSSHQPDIASLVILGNSLKTYVERQQELQSQASSSQQQQHHLSCLELVQPFVHEQIVECGKDDIAKLPGHLEAAFNDTFVTFFRPSSLQQCWLDQPQEPNGDDQDEVL